jgi:integrase/recombinase XerD
MTEELEKTKMEHIKNCKVISSNAIQEKQEKELVGSRQMQNCISEIIKIKQRYALTPEKSRYVDKMVRIKLKLQTIKRAKKLPEYMNKTELEHFLNTANIFNPTYVMLAELLLFTGLRVSESRYIDIRDIDYDNDQLKVVEGKGSKDRYVPLRRSLARKLKMYHHGRDRGYLFINRKGRQYSKRMLQHMIEKILEKCQFAKHLSTHSLRHTFACMAFNSGISLEKLQLIMGHTSRVTTEIYAKMELSSLKDEFLNLPLLD